jgi:hypothetical protein
MRASEQRAVTNALPVVVRSLLALTSYQLAPVLSYLWLLHVQVQLHTQPAAALTRLTAQTQAAAPQIAAAVVVTVMRTAKMPQSWQTAVMRSQVLPLPLLSWSVILRGDRSSTVGRTALLARTAASMVMGKTAMMVQHR